MLLSTRITDERLPLSRTCSTRPVFRSRSIRKPRWSVPAEHPRGANQPDEAPTNQCGFSSKVALGRQRAKALTFLASITRLVQYSAGPDFEVSDRALSSSGGPRRRDCRRSSMSFCIFATRCCRCISAFSRTSAIRSPTSLIRGATQSRFAGGCRRTRPTALFTADLVGSVIEN